MQTHCVRLKFLVFFSFGFFRVSVPSPICQRHKNQINNKQKSIHQMRMAANETRCEDLRQTHNVVKRRIIAKSIWRMRISQVRIRLSIVMLLLCFVCQSDGFSSLLYFWAVRRRWFVANALLNYSGEMLRTRARNSASLRRSSFNYQISICFVMRLVLCFSSLLCVAFCYFFWSMNCSLMAVFNGFFLFASAESKVWLN